MLAKAKGWHREDVKAAIRKRGTDLEELSVSNGLGPADCSTALRRPHFAAEMVIAEFLGVSPRQIWPHRYGADGAYRHPKSRTYHTRRGRIRERQNGDDA